MDLKVYPRDQIAKVTFQGQNDAALKDRYLRFQEFKKFRQTVERINSDSTLPFTAEMNRFSVERNDQPWQFKGLNITSDDDDIKVDWGDSSMDEGELGVNQELGSDLLPDHVDWREDLTPIRHQGYCGSCWAFSTVATMEWAYYTATGIRKIFSEQALVDWLVHTYTYKQFIMYTYIYLSL